MPSLPESPADRRQNPDRRRRRVDARAAEALRLYLESVLESGAMSALALSDDTGWLVACQRDERDIDLPRVASVGRWCAEGFDAGDEELDAAGGEDLYFHGLVVQGRRLFLTSLGARVASVREVARATERILRGGQLPDRRSADAA
jgi:hypothetical protein